MKCSSHFHQRLEPNQVLVSQYDDAAARLNQAAHRQSKKTLRLGEAGKIKRTHDRPGLLGVAKLPACEATANLATPSLE